MGLRDFTDPVEARLKVVLDKLTVAAPSFATGWKSTLMEHGAPPRIVWVPRGGPTKGDAIHGDDVTTGRRLATRHETIDVHVWCEDVAGCEDMANHLVAAMQDVAAGAHRVLGTTWDAGEASELTQAGQLYVVHVEVMFPWTRELSKAARGPVALNVTGSDPMAGS